MNRRREDKGDGRLALIARRLDVANNTKMARETYPENYWRHAYADDVATLVAVIDALALQIRGATVFEELQPEPNGRDT